MKFTWLNKGVSPIRWGGKYFYIEDQDYQGETRFGPGYTDIDGNSFRDRKGKITYNVILKARIEERPEGHGSALEPWYTAYTIENQSLENLLKVGIVPNDKMHDERLIDYYLAQGNSPLAAPGSESRFTTGSAPSFSNMGPFTFESESGKRQYYEEEQRRTFPIETIQEDPASHERAREGRAFRQQRHFDSDMGPPDRADDWAADGNVVAIEPPAYGVTFFYSEKDVMPPKTRRYAFYTHSEIKQEQGTPVVSIPHWIDLEKIIELCSTGGKEGSATRKARGAMAMDLFFALGGDSFWRGNTPAMSEGEQEAFEEHVKDKLEKTDKHMTDSKLVVLHLEGPTVELLRKESVLGNSSSSWRAWSERARKSWDNEPSDKKSVGGGYKKRRKQRKSTRRKYVKRKSTKRKSTRRKSTRRKSTKRKSTKDKKNTRRRRRR
tara:strand:+ start:33601 stop:34908 length:1308 start_codon:yes stop_codon:yes gene_type:complete